MSGTQYERELKWILERNPKASKLYREMQYKPWMVTRGAGSLGSSDLTPLRNNRGFMIEVKSSQMDVIRLSGSRLKIQRAESFEVVKTTGNTLLYAQRWVTKKKRTGTCIRCGQDVSDRWVLFRAFGFADDEFDFLPLPRFTKDRNPVLEFSEGLQLHEFLQMSTTLI